MHQLELEIPIKEPKKIYESIKPELTSSPTKESTINIKKQQNSLFLEIKSKNLPSFRAAMNSWLRWIQVAKKTSEIKKKI